MSIPNVTPTKPQAILPLQEHPVQTNIVALVGKIGELPYSTRQERAESLKVLETLEFISQGEPKVLAVVQEALRIMTPNRYIRKRLMSTYCSK